LWYQVGLLFFNYHNDARSNIHKIYKHAVVINCITITPEQLILYNPVYNYLSNINIGQEWIIIKIVGLFGFCGVLTKLAVLWVLIQSVGDVCRWCWIQFESEVWSNLLILAVIWCNVMKIKPIYRPNFLWNLCNLKHNLAWISFMIMIHFVMNVFVCSQ